MTTGAGLHLVGGCSPPSNCGLCMSGRLPGTPFATRTLPCLARMTPTGPTTSGTPWSICTKQRCDEEGHTHATASSCRRATLSEFTADGALAALLARMHQLYQCTSIRQALLGSQHSQNQKNKLIRGDRKQPSFKSTRNQCSNFYQLQ